MNRNHSLSLGNKGNILLGIYILLCLGITINMSFLITDTPLTGDAAQNFRLAYNKYKYGILSTDGENKEATLTHSNYREPLPPYVTALFMAVHPQVNKSQSYLSFETAGRNPSERHHFPDDLRRRCGPPFSPAHDLRPTCLAVPDSKFRACPYTSCIEA